MNLTQQQIQRYSRHIILDKVGGAGQQKLLESKVLIIGAGGLGSPAALFLAAAGVGTLGIVDGDKVDMTNLQRQVLHATADVGRDKVDSAVETIIAINPDVCIQPYKCLATAENIRQIIRDYDFVIDGTDNFASKFLINDACFFEKKAYSHAGVLAFDGQLMTVLPGQSTCYRCIFDAPPPPDSVPSCSQAGVLGVLPGVIGSLQATEAIKYVLGLGDLLTNSLLTYNALTMNFRRITVKRNKACSLCGDNPTVKELKDQQKPVCDIDEEK